MLFRTDLNLEQMLPQNMFSGKRVNSPLWTLGAESTFGTTGLAIFEGGAGATDGVAASIVAPILPGSKWKLITSSVFTVGSATVDIGGSMITLAGGTDEVNTIAVPVTGGDHLVAINQVVATGNVDVVFSKFELTLLDDAWNPAGMGYFGKND